MRHNFTFSEIQPEQIESTFEGMTLVGAVHHQDEGLIYLEFEKDRHRRTLIIDTVDSKIKTTNEYSA